MKRFLILILVTSQAHAAPKEDPHFFDGKSLNGWSAADMKYWSVKDGVIIGDAPENVPRNEFLWSAVEVSDFYLVVDVKLTPANRNAGIQFRSKPINDHGQAQGYQADVGAGVWGKLYHEHGRGKLDWNNRANSALKQADWNRYEILAVGHRIWTALNGTLCVALEDPDGELKGRISLQIHSGPPQNVQYRPVKLVHNPEIALENQNHEQLMEALPKKLEVRAGSPLKAAKFTSPENTKGWTDQIAKWRGKVDANDGGIAGEWFATETNGSDWKTMRLPGFYEGSGLPAHDGTTWFRKTITIPSQDAGKPLTIELGPIDDMDMTWFNGNLVGGIEVPGFWLKPRIYEVPGNLVKAGKNTIAVRVIDHGLSGGFGAANANALVARTNSGKMIPLDGSWKYKSGVSLKALGLGQLNNPARPWHPSMAKQAIESKPISALVRPLARPGSESKPKPFEGRFSIGPEETVVLLGGTNASECGRSGWLETHLVTAFSELPIRVRNLAQPTDTVFEQRRPRNFFGLTKPDYGEIDGRERIRADTAIVWFGQMESLAGEAGLPEFKVSYEKVLDQVSEVTPRIVLVTPVPFSDPLGLGFDLEKRNTDLRKYADTIRQAATDRNLPIVDLFTHVTAAEATSDGTLLSGNGHEAAAAVFAEALGFSKPLPPNAEYIRRLIQEKEEIWQRYWLPTNWAFLYGNRQTQPSSRNHIDPKKRWFPDEILKFLEEVRELDQTVHQTVKR